MTWKKEYTKPILIVIGILTVISGILVAIYWKTINAFVNVKLPNLNVHPTDEDIINARSIYESRHTFNDDEDQMITVVKLYKPPEFKRLKVAFFNISPDYPDEQKNLTLFLKEELGDRFSEVSSIVS